MASPLKGTTLVDTPTHWHRRKPVTPSRVALAVSGWRTRPNAEDLESADHILKNLDQMRVHDPEELRRVELPPTSPFAEKE
jgi:hypothetical protein